MKARQEHKTFSWLRCDKQEIFSCMDDLGSDQHEQIDSLSTECKY